MMNPASFPSLIPATSTGPTPTDAKELYYSPSQIETYADCARKWAFDKIDHAPRGTTKAAELGTRVHTQLERHLLGKGFDFASDHEAADIAHTAIPFLPAPLSDGLEVEHSFTERFDPSSPHKWTGRIDWRVILDKIKIGDHKTTSNTAYAKDASALQVDTQAIVYAYATLQEFPVPSVDLQWTYIPTAKGKLVVTETTLRRPEVEDRFGIIDTLATEINAARRGVTSAKDLPPNPNACSKYGGCPYQSRCNLSPRESLTALMSNGNEMTLLERLKAQQTGAVAPPPAAPGPAPAAITPDAAGSMSRFATRNAEGRVIADLRGRPLTADTIAKQYVQDPVTRGWLSIDPLTAAVAQYLETDATAQAAIMAAAVQPPAPNAPPAWTPLGAVAPPPAPAAPAYAPSAINPPEYQPPPAAYAPPTAYAPPAPAAHEAPAKRKRATKAEMEARRAAAGTPGAPPVFVAGPPSAPIPDADEKPIALLCINCVPVRADAFVIVQLDDLLPEVHALIKRDLQVDDYSLLDYGKGSGALSLYASAAVERAANAAGTIALCVDTRTREGAIVVSRLVAMSDSIIRGA